MVVSDVSFEEMVAHYSFLHQMVMGQYPFHEFVAWLSRYPILH